MMEAGTDFFGLPVYTGGADALKADLRRLMRRKGRPVKIFYLNPHVFNLAWRDRALRSALSGADMVLPDGWGLVWAARRKGLAVAERLAVSDHIETLAGLAASGRRSLFLWGGQPGVAEAAAARLMERHRGLRVAGWAHGFQGPAGKEKVMRRIKKSGAGMVLVGMGSPAQELLCAKMAGGRSPRLYASVGNALAFAAGLQRRAPRVFMALRLEWLWRLMLEPAKMWRRYLLGNFQFLALVSRRGWGS
jgi:exopolysaccharide biosynthesis WecB/TagA/CpsF family protein